MGVYLNSPLDRDDSKRVILDEIKATSLTEREFKTTTPTKGRALLCRVENFGFCALGVAIDDRERQAMVDPNDARPRRYYEADIAAIKQFINPAYIPLVEAGLGQQDADDRCYCGFTADHCRERDGCPASLV